ncbi:AlpA family phage regulatory protein [Bordetella tumbae]|uniref:helix-turn-helix transcriptional regulator n=1 Tax=Bordetella tumbae TaxID=1649139 RepID=UPI0039F0A615
MHATTISPGRTAPSTKPVHCTETYTAALPATGYVRLPVVAAVSGLAKSTVWKWCAEGRLPKPLKLSPRVSAWLVSDIRAWLADPAGWQAANASKVEG